MIIHQYTLVTILDTVVKPEHYDDKIEHCYVIIGHYNITISHSFNISSLTHVIVMTQMVLLLHNRTVNVTVTVIVNSIMEVLKRKTLEMT